MSKHASEAHRFSVLAAMAAMPDTATRIAARCNTTPQSVGGIGRQLRVEGLAEIKDRIWRATALGLAAVESGRLPLAVTLKVRRVDGRCPTCHVRGVRLVCTICSGSCVPVYMAEYTVQHVVLPVLERAAAEDLVARLRRCPSWRDAVELVRALPPLPRPSAQRRPAKPSMPGGAAPTQTACGRGRRMTRCSQYDRCLGAVAGLGWEGFSCSRCPLAEHAPPELRAAELLQIRGRQREDYRWLQGAGT